MRDNIIKELLDLIEVGKDVLKTRHYKPSIFGGAPDEIVSGIQNTAWRTSSIAFLANNFPDSSKEYIEEIKKSANYFVNSPRAVEGNIELLEAVKKQILSGTLRITDITNSTQDDIVLMKIFDAFHKVARQLRMRREDRATLVIDDEYDVQDLLHAILFIHFEDVRDEEWTPSYAGGSLRTDFLLKNEKIVIEVKKTRETMTAKKLGEELIIDIEKYKEHQDCEKLFCFVYDPHGILGNPTAIMNDLSNRHKGFAQVIIRPKM